MKDIQSLMLFLDVVDQESFVNAAKLRDTDPAQLTKKIKKLEKELGAVLLNRSTRSMSLTAVGEKVYIKAQKIKLLLEDIDNLTHDYTNKVQGRIRVTSAIFVGYKYVEPAIRDMESLYPNISFELELTDDQTDIIKEGFDVAIRQWKPIDSSLIATKLKDIELKLVASPKFIQKYGMPVTVNELALLPATLYRRKSLYRDKLQYFTEENELVSIQLHNQFVANDPRVMLSAVRAGNVFALMADYMVEDELKSGELIELLPTLPLPFENSVYAVYQHRNIPKGTKLFVDNLKKLFLR